MYSISRSNKDPIEYVIAIIEHLLTYKTRLKLTDFDVCLCTRPRSFDNTPMGSKCINCYRSVTYMSIVETIVRSGTDSEYDILLNLDVSDQQYDTLVVASEVYWFSHLLRVIHDLNEYSSKIYAVILDKYSMTIFESLITYIMCSESMFQLLYQICMNKIEYKCSTKLINLRCIMNDTLLALRKLTKSGFLFRDNVVRSILLCNTDWTKSFLYRQCTICDRPNECSHNVCRSAIMAAVLIDHTEGLNISYLTPVLSTLRLLDVDRVVYTLTNMDTIEFVDLYRDYLINNSATMRRYINLIKRDAATYVLLRRRVLIIKLDTNSKICIPEDILKMIYDIVCRDRVFKSQCHSQYKDPDTSIINVYTTSTISTTRVVYHGILTETYPLWPLTSQYTRCTLEDRYSGNVMYIQ